MPKYIFCLKMFFECVADLLALGWYIIDIVYIYYSIGYNKIIA